MKILPYHTFSLRTDRPLSEVINQLNRYVEPPKQFRWSWSHHHAPYAGTISSDGFEIHRIIHYRNSFLPKIRGRFESNTQGTIIHVTMRLHPLVIGFLAFWYWTWYSATIPMILFGVFSGDVVLVIGLLFLGLPLVLLVVFMSAFWYEANRSQGELTQIIQAETLESPTSPKNNRYRF